MVAIIQSGDETVTAALIVMEVMAISLFIHIKNSILIF